MLRHRVYPVKKILRNQYLIIKTFRHQASPARRHTQDFRKLTDLSREAGGIVSVRF